MRALLIFVQIATRPMLKDRIIQQVNEQLSQFFNNKPDGGEERNELQKAIHSIVQNVFSKLDLVTREEFDAQRKVLLATRARIEALEKELEELSKAPE